MWTRRSLSSNRPGPTCFQPPSANMAWFCSHATSISACGAATEWYRYICCMASDGAAVVSTSPYWCQ